MSLHPHIIDPADVGRVKSREDRSPPDDHSNEITSEACFCHQDAHGFRAQQPGAAATSTRFDDSTPPGIPSQLTNCTTASIAATGVAVRGPCPA